jgi:hypothetical protein
MTERLSRKAGRMRRSRTIRSGKPCRASMLGIRIVEPPISRVLRSFQAALLRLICFILASSSISVALA